MLRFGRRVPRMPRMLCAVSMLGAGGARRASAPCQWRVQRERRGAAERGGKERSEAREIRVGFQEILVSYNPRNQLKS